MAKKQRRAQHINNLSVLQNSNFELQLFRPKTIQQQHIFDLYNQGSNLLLHGYAGTGKTFISLYLALQEVLNPFSDYNQVIIVRSVVPTRDIGFLPGSEKQKMQVYELPYQAITSQLFNRGDAYDVLKNKLALNFITTSFIRGITIDNSVVIVDECQNMSFHELDSIITRLGDNSRIILAGDFKQSDLLGSDRQGLLKFINIVKNIQSFEVVQFLEEDIVRSGLVKDYIIQKERAS